ncbi:MAG TPA: hypothetical protein VFU15_14305, partial [Bacteroidia bacterium]|nr:hypothetical protein [Bacteroidia bacterium]
MTTLYYIPDVQLPESQDFNELMSEGRSFIQSHIGNEWTNLNASDPGVTILEQLCYALTELGYCIDFPMRDILTRKDGELETKDQFYFPEDILTTSPVTPDDYRKYLIDGVSNTGNAVVVQADGAYPVFLRNCMVYLMPVKTVSGVLAEAFCKSAFYYLNRNRYLATVFSQPEILADNAYYLQGTITISDGSGKSKILALVEESIRNYIFPTVIPASYATLTADSVATNDIFNGPHLENGWIPSSSLGVNRTQLWASELYSVIKSVSGVTEVNALGFVPVSTSQATGSTSSESTDQITSSLSELIVIKVKDSGFIIVESPQPSKQTTPDPLLVAAETIEAEFDLNI